MNIFNVVNVSHDILLENLKKDAICVDATCGNGNDTLFIANNINEKGFIYAFDIQKQACVKTSSMLRRNHITNAKVICDSHDNIDKYIDDKIDCAVFNLGYLPKSDSEISTKPKTTICAIEKILELLNVDGFIIICAYVAHDGGMREYNKTLKLCAGLNSKKYQTLLIEQPNKKRLHQKLFLLRKKLIFRR